MTRHVLAGVVLTVALLAPWPFGSVEPYFFGAASALVLGAGAVWSALTARSPVDAPAGMRGFAAAVLAVPAVALLSMVPLPRALVALLSPQTVATMESAAPPAAGSWLPLSLHAHATLDAAVVAAAVAVTALLIAWIASSGAARRIAWAFVWGGVLLALFGLVQRLTQSDGQVMFWSIELNERGTPFGPYVNRNHFGGAMLLFSGVAAGLARDSHLRAQHRERGAAFAVLALFVVALLATTSRGAILGLGVLTVFVLLFLIPRAARRRAILALAALVVLAAGALLALGLLGDIAARAELQPRWLNRFLVQKDALAVFTQFPLFGTGAGTFPTVFHVFQTVPDDRHFNDAHSDWAQFLMETGVIGAAVGLWLAMLLIRRLRRAAPGPGRALALGAGGGLAALAVHGFLETNLHIPANALLAAVAAGIAWGSSVPAALAAAPEGAAVSSLPGSRDDDQNVAPVPTGGD